MDLKKIISSVFFLFLFLSLSPLTFIQAVSKSDTEVDSLETASSAPDYVPGEVIVKFKKDKLNISSNNLITSVKKFSFPLLKGLSTKSEDPSGNIVVYKVNRRSSVKDAVTMLRQDASIVSAEPNYYRHLYTINTNDTYKTNLWGLDNVGQTLTLSSGETSPGTAGADIDMPQAWALSTGTTEVIVAVIDTGVAYNHPDLVNNMWDGTNCVDENGDPLGDCLHGYDFEDNDKDPLPTSNSHGTHVAGTIAATQNNNKGIAGIGPNIKIMAIKCDLSVSCIVSSINFAKENGAKVINASYGGSDYSTAEYDAISAFENAGGIFVAAAGNDGTDNDIDAHVYPSDYNLPEIISVAALDQGDSLASFSNIGATSVDIAAPGVNIYSTFDENYLINETFNNATAPEIPSGWTSDYVSDWGTYNLGGTGPVYNVLYGDLQTPYDYPVNSLITHDTVDLSSATNARFDFITKCDTENTDPNGSTSDYMALEISSDGSSYTELLRWNTYSLYELAGSNTYEFNQPFASQYLTSSFKFRLRWVTDNDTDRGSGDGCLVKNLKIISFTDGSDEDYDYLSGTSMAAPHVSGLAGYLWSITPSLTNDEVRSNILANGDSLNSLSGKMVTDKRINAYNSVVALGISATGPAVTGLSNDSTPTRSKTWTWSSANPSTDTYRYSIDQSLSSVPSGSYGVGNTAIVSSGTGTYYLHVQAKDENDNEGAVSTVSCILDNLGPSATLDSGNTAAFVLDFGENLYNIGGSSFSSNGDVSGFFSANPSSTSITSAVYDNQQVTVSVSNVVAGSTVALNTGTSATSFYDSLGNISSSFSVYFDGANWQNNSGSFSVAAAYLPDLFVSGVFTTSPGTTDDTSLSIGVSGSVLISVGDVLTTSSVALDNSLTISEYSDNEFIPSQLQISAFDPSTAANLSFDYVGRGGVRWGVSDLTLKFSSPVTINIYVGDSYNGNLLHIFRSSSLDTGWTAEGLVDDTCTVNSGFCQFTTNLASYFIAASSASITPSPTPVPESSVNNSSSPSTFTITHDAPQCTAVTPLKNPDLFKIITTKGSAKIIFTPVDEQITGYVVNYGFKKDDDRFSAVFNYVNSNEGEQNFTINLLNPWVTYYFRVAALNNCTAGPWSDWVPAKANTKKTIHKYKTSIVNKKVILINQFP